MNFSPPFIPLFLVQFGIETVDAPKNRPFLARFSCWCDQDSVLVLARQKKMNELTERNARRSRKNRRRRRRKRRKRKSAHSHPPPPPSFFYLAIMLPPTFLFGKWSWLAGEGVEGLEIGHGPLEKRGGRREGGSVGVGRGGGGLGGKRKGRAEALAGSVVASL